MIEIVLFDEWPCIAVKGSYKPKIKLIRILL